LELWKFVNVFQDLIMTAINKLRHLYFAISHVWYPRLMTSFICSVISGVLEMSATKSLSTEELYLYLYHRREVLWPSFHLMFVWPSYRLFCLFYTLSVFKRGRRVFDCLKLIDVHFWVISKFTSLRIRAEETVTHSIV